MERPICTECGEPCKLIEIDVGLGTVECWGSVSVDQQTAEVSACCEAEAQEQEEVDDE